jgi:hypothetical protein
MQHLPIFRYHQVIYRPIEDYQCKADQKGRLEYASGIPVVMIRTWRIPPHAHHPLESPHDLSFASLYTFTHHTLRPSLQTRTFRISVTYSLSQYSLLREKGLYRSPAICCIAPLQVPPFAALPPHLKPGRASGISTELLPLAQSRRSLQLSLVPDLPYNTLSTPIYLTPLQSRT